MPRKRSTPYISYCQEEPSPIVFTFEFTGSAKDIAEYHMQNGESFILGRFFSVEIKKEIGFYLPPHLAKSKCWLLAEDEIVKMIFDFGSGFTEENTEHNFTVLDVEPL